MNFRSIIKRVDQYYTAKVNEHGATARGVDWNSPGSQELRFEQLLRVCNNPGPFSINDYGCGYGAMIEYMDSKGLDFQYRGYDISEQMVAEAKRLHGKRHNCSFLNDGSLLTAADYTVASGIFNVKLGTSDEEWQQYVLSTMGRLDELSRRGFAFNVLTSYSDPDRKRPDLYYADPLFIFDYCKTHFSRHVSLLHDYGLYEFSIIVRNSL